MIEGKREGEHLAHPQVPETIIWAVGRPNLSRCDSRTRSSVETTNHYGTRSHMIHSHDLFFAMMDGALSPTSLLAVTIFFGKRNYVGKAALWLWMLVSVLKSYLYKMLAEQVNEQLIGFSFLVSELECCDNIIRVLWTREVTLANVIWNGHTSKSIAV